MSLQQVIKFNNFLRVLANQTGNLSNIDGLSVDVGIARETVYDYSMLKLFKACDTILCVFYIIMLL